MNIVQWLSNDEYKQKEIAKFIVEAALLQFLLSFLMVGLYVFTNIEPLFLLMIPFASFLFYSLIRYMLSGIEFAEVFTEEQVKKALKRNLIRAVGTSLIMMILFLLVESPFLDSVMIAVIAGALLCLMNATSLRKSIKKNREL